MYYKIKLVISILIILSVTSCNKGRSDIDFFGETVDSEVLEKVTLTIYTPFPEHKRQEDINKVLEEKLLNDLNLEIEFIFDPAFFPVVNSAVKDNEDIDAFIFYPNGFQHNLDWVANEELALDISELLPEYAENYYNALDSEQIATMYRGNKLIAVPPNLTQSNKLYSIIQTDIQDKYSIGSITNWNELSAAAEIIHRNEPERNALTFNYNMVALFAQYYGYYILHDGISIVYSGNDYQFKTWESVPEYSEALEIYKSWYDKGYLTKDMYNIELEGYLIETGAFPLTVGTFYDLIFMNRSAMQYDLPWRYNAYPIESNVPDTKLPIEEIGLVVTANSDAPERVLMFIEWLHESQENYDLFNFGILNEDYLLEEEQIAPPSNIAYSDLFYERPREYILDLRYERLTTASPHLDKDLLMNVLEDSDYPPHFGMEPYFSDVFYSRYQNRYALEELITNGAFTDENYQRLIERIELVNSDTHLNELQTRFDKYRQEDNE